MSQESDLLILEYVEFIPSLLKPGVLYVSIDYGTSAHLCPCGCNSKVILPITPPNWELEVENNVVSVEPSIGNWELPCQSHYWISNGKIVWAEKWSKTKIEESRLQKFKNLKSFFRNRANNRKKRSFFEWLQCLVR